MRPHSVCLSALLAVALSGCGGVFGGDRDPTITELSANGATVVPAPAGAGAPGTRDAPLTVAPGSVVVSVCRAEDPDDDALTFTWPGQNAAGQIGPSHVLAWTAPATEGRYVLTCVVDDGRGGTARGEVHLQVVNAASNHPPTAALAPNQATVAPGATAQFVCAATDTDQGDTLTYAFLPTQGTVSVDPADPTKATYTAPMQVGDQTLYCVVGDGKGGYSVATAAISVQ